MGLLIQAGIIPKFKNCGIKNCGCCAALEDVVKPALGEPRLMVWHICFMVLKVHTAKGVLNGINLYLPQNGKF